MRIDVTRPVKCPWFDDLAKAYLLDSIMYGIGPAGLFERRFEHAVLQFGAVVQAMGITENCKHSAHPLI
ncbi:hypothetical protein EMIT043CA1_30148 [Pseudomonas brassicacearum]